MMRRAVCDVRCHRPLKQRTWSALLATRETFCSSMGVGQPTCLQVRQLMRIPHGTLVRYSSTLTEEQLQELKYLERDDLRVRYDSLAASSNFTWEEFKTAVDAAAIPVDRRILPIYATLTLSFVSQGCQFPVLPLLARSLELSTADLGFVSAATALARLVTNAPAMRAAQHFGRRPMLIAGPSMAGVGMAMLSVSSSFSHLVVANLCVGTGLATTMAGASLYLADISTPLNRAQTTAPILQSALIGFAIGPAVGGLLASYALSMPFVACSGALAASSIASATLLPETMHEVSRRTEALRRSQVSSQQEAAAEKPRCGSWTALLHRPALQGLGAAVFMNGFAQGAFPVTLVLFAVEHLGMSSAAVGGMLTANVAMMVLITQPATRLSDRLQSRKHLMVPAMTAAAAFTGLQPLCTMPEQFAALVGLNGMAQAISMPSISPLVLDSVSSEERPKALAGRQMAQDAGALVGASSVGLFASAMGIPAAMEAVAVLQLASVAFFAIRVPAVPNHHRKPLHHSPESADDSEAASRR